jgi:NADH-quinone oxidoreductase subunit E
MAPRRLDPNQPASFAFTPENLAWAKATIANYPEGKQASAVIPVLWRAQEQHANWLPEPAIRLVADMLGMAYIRVYEIATFYTMFRTASGRSATASPSQRNSASSSPASLAISADRLRGVW